MAAEPYLFQGFLDDFYFNPDGDYFVLRYSEAITLNVVYIKLSDQGPSRSTGTPSGTEDGARPAAPPFDPQAQKAG